MLYIGTQQITSMAAATTLTIPGTGSNRANCALLIAKEEGVRVRRDGSAATASVGFWLPPDTPTPFFDDLANISVIEVAASAELCIMYYKR
jgi:hypothetical protein